MSLPKMLVAVSAQDAATHLIRALIDRGKSDKKDKNGRLRLVLPDDYVLIIANPTWTATAFGRCQPNPGFRLASALMEHSKIKNQKLLEPWVHDPYWDQTVGFEPKIAFTDEDGRASMRAEVENREIVSDLLSSDLLQLGLMMELMCIKSNFRVGRLAVAMSGCYLDVDEHLPFLRMLEEGHEPRDLYAAKQPTSVVLNQQSFVDFRSEVEFLLTDQAPPFGLRQPWLRRVAQPVLRATKAYIEGDARWRIHLDEIADTGWRESVWQWIAQDLEKPQEAVPVRGGNAV